MNHAAGPPLAGRTYPLRRSLCTQEDGGVALETALVLPVFFLLLFGLFYFAIVLFGYCNATYASRTAARYASLHSSTSLVPATTTTVQNVATPFTSAIPAGTATITTTWTPSNTIGSTVKVSASIVYTIRIPYAALTSVTVGSSMQRIITR